MIGLSMLLNKNRIFVMVLTSTSVCTVWEASTHGEAAHCRNTLCLAIRDMNMGSY